MEMTTATTPGSNDDLADCGLDHLIIVCCHAIYFGDEKIDSGSGNDITENGWYVLSNTNLGSRSIVNRCREQYEQRRSDCIRRLV